MSRSFTPFYLLLVARKAFRENMFCWIFKERLELLDLDKNEVPV